MKFVFSLFIICFVLTVAPIKATAGSLPKAITETERNYFLNVIAKLSEEVIRLQKILQERTLEQKICTLPKTSLFNRSFETNYCVKAGKLVNQNGEGVKSIDQALFNLFRTVVGSEVVDQSILYWRVFDDEDSETDAFVESVNDYNHYMVSVNRFGYRDDAMIKKSYAELFTHEYAHIILLKQPDLVKDFKESFWTSSDIAWSTRLGQISPSLAQRERNSFFNKNYERFVSDYATQSVDEDMAETFLTVVTVGWPSKSATDLKAEKQRFFQKNSELFAQREIIHSNLVDLGVLK